MKKWLTVGAVAMLVAWLPFLYAELTSEDAERRDRDLPTVVGADDISEAVPAQEPEEPAVAAAPQAPDEAEGENGPPEAPGAPPEGQPQAPDEPAAENPPHEVPAEPGALAAAQHPEEGEPEGADEEAEEEAEPEPPVASGPVSVLRKAFEQQPRDALWAKDTEHRLRGLFGTADVPADMLTAAACRSSVCRLDMKWAPEHATAYVGVYEASTQLSGAELGVEPEGEVEDDGSQRVHLYVTRRGYTMADLAR